MSCGCKGIRTCLLCEREKVIHTKFPGHDTEFYQCYKCGKLLTKDGIDFKVDVRPLGECIDQLKCSPTQILCPPGHVISHDMVINFSGIVVIKDFINSYEEATIIPQIDSSPWAESQSGRNKQDYGPKVNFKKRKVKIGHFNGLPSYSQSLISKMADISILNEFHPVELCNLDYQPERGASIDPHQDDDWIWGERLITINYLSSTYLTFTHPDNLLAVHIPLPNCSLVVVKGDARYVWLHSIRRENIIYRRVAMTMRELGTDFLDGQQEEIVGRDLLTVANSFCGQPVNFR